MKKKLSVFCSLLLALSMILPMAVMPVFAEDGDDTEAKYTVPESPAVTYNMNVDWKFKKAASGKEYPLATALGGVEKDGKQFYEVGYDDSDWETVSVPHPINAEDSFDSTCLDSGEQGLYRGFMFYRKNITIPASDAGKKLFLEFEAFRQSVYLYVNGQIVGYYEAGVAPIGFDITDYVTAGEENLIAVATDNASDRGATFATKETKPGSAAGAADGYGYQWNTKDFNEVQGGLTGNVNLYAKNTIYQTLPLYNNLKTTGSYIYAKDFDIREKTATVVVEGEIRNESETAKDITLEVNIVDTDGNLVKTFSQNGNVAVAEDKGAKFRSVIPADAYDDEPAATNADTVKVTKITASAEVTDLNFWSTDAPNLYDVYTILKDGETVIDVQKTTTGFRKVEYDISDGGLKINDKPVWLTGYAQRSTNEWAVIGVANDWLSDFDMQLLKESNSNFIRWMHIAPNPVDIRAGDKYGVVSAVPAGDKEGDADGRTWDQRVEAMRDVMIYFRNSPSVLFWEAGNNAVSAEHMQEMTDLKTLLDPNGGRFSGSRTISSTDQIKAADYVGTMLNRNASTAKASMKSLNKYVPIMETEYARDEAPRRVWDDFSPPDYDYDNKWLGAGASKQDGYDVHDLTSEDFAVVDAKAYNEFYSDRVGGSSGNDYYSAAAIMVWSDSNMHNRNTASENCRTSGKVDPIRIKKQAFYAMQAAQSQTPKIHIVGHWNYPEYIKGDKENGNYWYAEKTYNGTFWEKTSTLAQRDPTKKTVYVIGSPNLAKVELYVNDDLVGTSTKPDSTFVYSFPNVDVTKSGKVSAKAYSAQNEVVAEHEIETVGDPVGLKITAATGPEGLIADGSDIAYFDIAVVDKDGKTYPLAYDKINLSVSGEGVLLGGYNSGVGDKNTTGKDYVYAECGVNRVFVRSTRNAGTITLSASLEGKPAVTSSVTSKALELTGGLTTQMQQSLKQGEIIQPVESEVDPLKPLAAVFTADFGADGNTKVIDPFEDVDKYTMKVNGESVLTYTLTPYRPDSTTGVLCDVEKTLKSLQDAGVNVTYTLNKDGEIPSYTDGTLPILSITGGLKDGYTQIDIQNGSTTLFINGGEDKNLLNAEVFEKDGELIADIGAVLGYIEGISYSMNENAKTANIVTSGSGAILEYGDGTARVIARGEIEGKLIFASYNTDGTLNSLDVKNVKLTGLGAYNDYTPASGFTKTSKMKAMLWQTDFVTPICDAVDMAAEEN